MHDNIEHALAGAFHHDIYNSDNIMSPPSARASTVTEESELDSAETTPDNTPRSCSRSAADCRDVLVRGIDAAKLKDAAADGRGASDCATHACPEASDSAVGIDDNASIVEEEDNGIDIDADSDTFSDGDIGLERDEGDDGSDVDEDIQRQEEELQQELIRASVRCDGIRAFLDAAKGASEAAGAGESELSSGRDIASARQSLLHAHDPATNGSQIVAIVATAGGLRSSRFRVGLGVGRNGNVPVRQRRRAIHFRLNRSSTESQADQHSGSVHLGSFDAGSTTTSPVTRPASAATLTGSRQYCEDRPIRPSTSPNQFRGLLDSSTGLQPPLGENSSVRRPQPASRPLGTLSGTGGSTYRSAGTSRPVLAPSTLAKLRSGKSSASTVGETMMLTTSSAHASDYTSQSDPVTSRSGDVIGDQSKASSPSSVLVSGGKVKGTDGNVLRTNAGSAAPKSVGKKPMNTYSSYGHGNSRASSHSDNVSTSESLLIPPLTDGRARWIPARASRLDRLEEQFGDESEDYNDFELGTTFNSFHGIAAFETAARRSSTATDPLRPNALTQADLTMPALFSAAHVQNKGSAPMRTSVHVIGAAGALASSAVAPPYYVVGNARLPRVTGGQVADVGLAGTTKSDATDLVLRAQTPNAPRTHGSQEDWEALTGSLLRRIGLLHEVYSKRLGSRLFADVHRLVYAALAGNHDPAAHMVDQALLVDYDDPIGIAGRLLQDAGFSDIDGGMITNDLVAMVEMELDLSAF